MQSKQGKALKNIVVGVVFDDSTGVGWWIMADGSKLSGAKEDEVLPFLQAIQNKSKSMGLWQDCKYILSVIRRDLLYVLRKRLNRFLLRINRR